MMYSLVGCPHSKVDLLLSNKNWTSWGVEKEEENSKVVREVRVGFGGGGI